MSPLRGLYAITAQSLLVTPDRLLSGAEQALRGGCRLLQYRDKWSPPLQRRQNARALLQLCRTHQVPLILNDDLELAAELGADGVHLGAQDANPVLARQRLGPTALIGVTCGSDLDRAQRAAAAGASYVAFGRFFPSRTKPDAPAARPEVLRQARNTLSLPLCAIGGITPANAPQLIAAGADLIAAVAGVFEAENIEDAARRYANLFK